MLTEVCGRYLSILSCQLLSLNYTRFMSSSSKIKSFTLVKHVLIAMFQSCVKGNYKRNYRPMLSLKRFSMVAERKSGIEALRATFNIVIVVLMHHI